MTQFETCQIVTAGFLPGKKNICFSLLGRLIQFETGVICMFVFSCQSNPNHNDETRGQLIVCLNDVTSSVP